MHSPFIYLPNLLLKLFDSHHHFLPFLIFARLLSGEVGAEGIKLLNNNLVFLRVHCPIAHGVWSLTYYFNKYFCI